jgi:hypothetical protein
MHIEAPRHFTMFENVSARWRLREFRNELFRSFWVTITHRFIPCGKTLEAWAGRCDRDQIRYGARLLPLSHLFEQRPVEACSDRRGQIKTSNLSLVFHMIHIAQIRHNAPYSTLPTCAIVAQIQP